MSEPEPQSPPQPKRRPSFSIAFEFTDFTPGEDLDRDALGQTIFDHLIQGPVDADGDWSIDGFEVLR